MLPKGTKVRLSKGFIESGRDTEYLGAHIEEFEGEEGEVIGSMFEDTDEFVDVRWFNSGFRFGYKVEDLEILDEKR